MVVNDNAGFLKERGVLESIASRLAPTESRAGQGLLSYNPVKSRNANPLRNLHKKQKPNAANPYIVN
ncbi:hypothetical protein EJA72_26230 [Pseudomonas sp. PB120]|nr:hypothetical protein [Pseudomonas sp. PB120]